MHGFSGATGHTSGFGLGIGHDKGFAYGVHDLNFGHGGHAGTAIFDAIIVGRDFTSGHTTAHVDSSVDTHSNFHAADGSMEGNGPSALDAAPRADRTNFGLLLVGISAVDWETMARQDMIQQGAVECFNLQLATPRIAPPSHFQTLLPVNFKNPQLPVKNPVMPKGFYEGATGSTTLWRTNYQVGQRNILEKWAGRPARRGKNVRTYIEEEVTEWHFFEANDFEIRLVVRVLGGKDPYELMQHLALAQAHCQSMFKRLSAKVPSKQSQDFRRALAVR